MGLRRACLPPLPRPPASRYGLASLRRSGLTRLPPLRAREHPSPRDALPPAPPAGIMPKPHERQQFARPCALFSPARVDNSLQQALPPARSYTPWSAQAAAWGRPRLAAASRWRSAVAGGRGARPSGFPEIPRRASGTALRRQGRSVARAAGPRHRRPRLRHRTHRRGDASAASRPPQARARVVKPVHLSAQPLADRSVQWLIPRCRWTTPADCWATRRYSSPHRLGNALEPTLRLASPPCPLGARRKAPAPLRSARATGSCHPPSTS
jgi:hypothetical protein